MGKHSSVPKFITHLHELFPCNRLRAQNAFKVLASGPSLDPPFVQKLPYHRTHSTNFNQNQDAYHKMHNVVDYPMLSSTFA